MKIQIVLPKIMKDEFEKFLKSDKKDFKGTKTPIYYELMNLENCKKRNKPLGTFNAIDGRDLFLEQKKEREKAGYTYSKPKPINFRGIKLNMHIIRKEGCNFEDHFGLINDYYQASCEVVCFSQFVK